MMKVETSTDSVTTWLKYMPEKMHKNLLKTVFKLTILLQNKVRNEKLAGQVLNYHSHKLQQSIQTDVKDSSNSVMGEVFNNRSVAPYGAIHERGGVIPGHEIVAKKADALAFLWNGKQMFLKRVYIPPVTMPARPYLHPSLYEMEDQIVGDMTKAVYEGGRP